jgi:lysophospholipase L1-like esterase
LKRWIQSIALALASVAVLLVLLEAGVRLFVPPSRWLFLDAAADWKLDLQLGWVNQPDLDVTSQTPYGSVRFRTNPDGLIPATAARAKAPGTTRIMIFGDSMVVGRFFGQDEIYSARLERALRERGLPVEVINAGVQGYSTDQALLLMERWVPTYRPDVVIYGSTLNDYGGNSLDTAYGQAKPSFRVDDEQRLRLSPPKLRAKIESFGHGPRRWLQDSALYRFVQPGIFLLRAQLFGLQERILLGAEQGLYIGNATVAELDWKLYEALVVRMEQDGRKFGARFVFFAHPEVGEVWEPYIESVCKQLQVERKEYDPFTMERRLIEMAQRRNLEFLPLIQAFRDQSGRGPFHLIPMDAHLNPAGHALLAEILSERLAPELAAPAAEAH